MPRAVPWGDLLSVEERIGGKACLSGSVCWNRGIGSDMNICVRRMQPQDIEGVAHIEEVCFSKPWSVKSLTDSFLQPDYCFYVAVNGEDPVGYIGSYRTADELNITNVAVLPLWRKRGIAASLLSELCSYAADRGFYGITLEVRESNTAATALYEKFGFTCAGKRKNYYDDPTEDALILWKYFEE